MFYEKNKENILKKISVWLIKKTHSIPYMVAQKKGIRKDTKGYYAKMETVNNN